MGRELIRVLHVFHEMSNGGIEHFVMDYYRHIDRTRIQFDFLVSVNEDGYFDDEIKNLGGKIYHAYPFKKNPIKNFFDIARIVKKNEYQIVHRHTGSAFGYFDLKAASYGGAQKVIMHSHNNQAGNVFVHTLCNLFLKVPCEKLACSQEAGEWLFGRNGRFNIINNAIDTQKFVFNSAERQEFREIYGVSDQFVIGHVGRLEEQKNHMFLLKIFTSVLDRKKDCVLVLIGDGSLMEEIKNEARITNILDKIIFLGSQKEAAKFYNMFDVFVLPSKYEGFGITLLEAQTNGLHCFTSANVVPASVNVTGSIRYISLENDSEVWAEEIIKVNERNDIEISSIQNAGFDIEENAKNLCSYYEKLISTRRC